jgi:hypothetical protein
MPVTAENGAAAKGVLMVNSAKPTRREEFVMNITNPCDLDHCMLAFVAV